MKKTALNVKVGVYTVRQNEKEIKNERVRGRQGKAYSYIMRNTKQC